MTSNIKADISIIIPTKNMGKYIETCLISILKESTLNIEIIIVDFGSEDATLKIVNKYMVEDARIIVVYDENGDAASARDKGIRVASGEYLSFIDADDWIEDGKLSLLYQQAVQSNVDIISARYKSILEKDKSVLYKSKFCDIEELVQGENIDTVLCGIARGDFNLEVWNKLYRRKFLIDNDIHFNSENGINGEDVLFNLECIFFFPSIKTTSLMFYNHLIRENSLANSVGKQLSLRFMTIVQILVNEMDKKSYSCENGLSQVMVSLQIQDLMDSEKKLVRIKNVLRIYESFSFYKNFLSLAISSKSSTLNRKVLCLLMKVHAYRMILFISKQRG